MNDNKIQLEAKRDCKYCLGSGLAMSIAGSPHVCSCILEGVTVIVYDKDYSTLDRKNYGLPTMVKMPTPEGVSERAAVLRALNR